MNTPVLLLLLANVCICKMEVEYENFYSQNGWRPILNDRVFNDYLTIPSRTAASSVHEETSDNALEENIIKVVNPPEFVNEFTRSTVHGPTAAADGTGQSAGYHDNYYLNNADGLEELFTNKKGSNNSEWNKTLRRSRKMNMSPVYNLKHDNENTQNESQPIENKYSTYEVVEESDPHDALSTEQNIFYINNNNKQHLEDVENKSNNFTSNLINILSNYNIRSNDNLQNYALSLRRESSISNNRGQIYMPVPLRIPLKHNSANHLPVDPLLAVLLSNYGYYVPGLYGFKQNYPNLYGYLASNNIHNNRPFGAYKLFSDTDSYL